MAETPATQLSNPFFDAVRAYLAERFTTRAARALAAGLSATLCAFATGGGIFITLGLLQGSVVVGVAAGIVAPSRRSAAVASGIGWSLGAFFAPTDPLLGLASTATRFQNLLWIVVATGVAWGLAALSHHKGARRIAVWAVAVLLVANMWNTAYNANSKAMRDPSLGRVVPSKFEQLEGQMPPEYAKADEYFYLKVIRRLDQGDPYYESYAAEQLKHFGPDNPIATPIMIREPLAFWLLSMLPGVGKNIVWVYLVLASAAVLCVPILIRRVAPVALAVPGTCALAAYLLYATVGIHVLALEPWIGALGVIVLTLLAVAGRSPRWMIVEPAAAVVAVFATVVRELAFALPLAGLVASLLARGERLKYRTAVWGVAVVLSGAGLAAHWSQASKYVTSSGRMYMYFRGGWANLVSGLGWGVTFFGERGGLVATYAVLGIIGALAIRERRLFWYAVAMTLGPIALFLFTGNGSVHPVLGTPNNYWGAAYLPSMIALSPLVMAWLPGLSATPYGDS